MKIRIEVSTVTVASQSHKFKRLHRRLGTELVGTIGCDDLGKRQVLR
jgi:hypothetical protein